jgi:hypothetical protein
MGGALGDIGWKLAVYENAGATDIYVAGQFRDTVPFDTGSAFVSQTSAGGQDGFLLKDSQEQGAISGNVQRDVGIEGQVAQSGWTVYLDGNANGQLDAGETSTTTGPQGFYELYHLPAGDYTVRQALPPGYTQVSPAGGAGHAVTLSARQFVTDRNFTISGPTQSLTFNSNASVNIPSAGTCSGWNMKATA